MSSLGSLMVIIGANTSGLTAAQHDLRRLQTAMTHTQSAFKTLEQGMVTFGRTLTQYVTLPVTLLGIAAVKTFADFEYELAKIEGLVGISGATVQEWGNQILEMASSFGKAPQELAESLYFITSSGFKSAEAMEVMKISAMTAAAGLGETKDIANIVTSAINAYGRANITAAQAADVLTVAVREGKGEPAELVKAFATVIPVAAKLGVHFDQVGGAIAAMTRYGIPAANASTYLRQTLFTLLKPTNQVKKGLAQFGLTAQDVRNSLRSDGLIDTLQMLQEKIGTNEEALGQIFPNIRAFMGVTSLLGANLEETIGVFNDTKNSLGATAAAFEIISQTTKFKFNAAMAEAKATLIKFGEAIMEVLLPTVISITGKIRNLGNWFTGLSKPTQELIIKVLGFTAAVGPLLLILNLLITVTIRPLILLLTTLRNVIRTVIIQMGLMTKAGSLLTTVINLQKIAYLAWAYQIAYVTGNKTKLVAITKVLNKVIAATPWGWVALAIGAVVTVLALLIKKKKELTDVEKISNEISTEVNNSVAKEVAHLDRLKRVLDNNTSSEEQRAVAIRELNKTMSIYTGGIIVEKEEIEKLIKVSKDEKRTKTEREEALQEATRLQEIYNKGITEEKVRTGQAADMINTYMGMLKKKYTLQAAEQLIVKKMAEQLELQDKIAQGEGLSDKEKAKVIIPRSLANFALIGPVAGITNLFKQADWLAEATQKKVTALETSVSWLQETISSLSDQVFGIEEIQITGVAPPDIIPDDFLGETKEKLTKLQQLQKDLTDAFDGYQAELLIVEKTAELYGKTTGIAADKAKVLETVINLAGEAMANSIPIDKAKLEAVINLYNSLVKLDEEEKVRAKVLEDGLKVQMEQYQAWLTYINTGERLVKANNDLGKSLTDMAEYVKYSGGEFTMAQAAVEIYSDHIKNLRAELKGGNKQLIFIEILKAQQKLKEAKGQVLLDEYRRSLELLEIEATIAGNSFATFGETLSFLENAYKALLNEGIRSGAFFDTVVSGMMELRNLANTKDTFTELGSAFGELVSIFDLGEETWVSYAETILNAIPKIIEMIMSLTAATTLENTINAARAESINNTQNALINETIALDNDTKAIGLNTAAIMANTLAKQANATVGMMGTGSTMGPPTQEQMLGGGMGAVSAIGGGMGAASGLGQIAKIAGNFSAILGGILGVISIISLLFKKKKKAQSSYTMVGMALGGIVPPGYPNDSYPAMLTSGEAVIPAKRLPEFERQEMDVNVTVDGVVRGSDIHYIVREVERRYKNTY